MTVDQLIELEIIARDRMAALETEMEKAREHLKPPEKLGGAEGRLSRQDSMLSHEMAKEAQRRRKNSLGELQEAVGRMDAGTYGKCEHCGNMISYERLRILPESRLCESCSG